VKSGLKTFEECIEKISYRNKIQRTNYLTEGKFPVVSQEFSLINGYWNQESEVIYVEKPVIVFGDHTRVLKYIDFSFVLGADGTKIIKPKDFIETKFFYYFLQANPLETKGYARHYRFLKKLSLYVPPLPTQQKIVAKLDRVFAEIDKATVVAEANIKNAEALFLSFLHKIFLKIGNHNKSIKLSEIIRLEYGKGLKECDRDLNGTYGVYGANGIKSKTNRFLYNKPSIVVGRKGSAGELTIVTEKFWALDVTYYVIHDDKKTDLYFLYYALKNLNIPSLAKGIKPGINRNDVYNLLITIPNINEQKLIVKNILNFSNNLNLVISSYKKRKIEFQFLKQSILKQAFNSELVKAA
jgi:type I restriction enzyme S subunit